jgi:hypothetical protein
MLLEESESKKQSAESTERCSSNEDMRRDNGDDLRESVSQRAEIGEH